MSIAEKPARAAHALLLLALAAALASAAVRGSRRWTSEGLPLGDQGANLALAIGLREAGGWGGWLRGCADGTYLEDNRHPLLPLLLAPFAERSPDFLPRARAAAAALSTLGAVLWLITAAKAAGPWAGLTSLAFLAAAPAWGDRTTLVGPESLLAPLAGCVWLARARGGASSGALAGAAAGAFYLLKGSALPWTVGLLGGAWLGGASRRGLAAAAASFLAVCAPMLWRDMTVFGRPFHNVNANILWLDVYWEYYPLAWTGAISQIGASSYFSAHGAWDAAARGASGAAAVLANAARGATPLGSIGALLFALLAARGWVRDSDRPRRRAAAAAVGLLAALASWYAAVDPSDRYMLPALPVAAFYAATASADLWRRLAPRLRVGAACLAAAGGAVCLLDASLEARVTTWTVRDPEFLQGMATLDGRLSGVRGLVTDGDDFFLWLVRPKPRAATLPLGPRAAWRFAEAAGADAALFFADPGTPPAAFAPVFANGRMAYFERR